MSFKNVEVYVRIADYSWEGETLRFATVDENQALTYFSDDDDEIYAPDSDIGEELRVYIDGKYKEVWYRRNGEWIYPSFGPVQKRYGVIVTEES